MARIREASTSLRFSSASLARALLIRFVLDGPTFFPASSRDAQESTPAARSLDAPRADAVEPGRARSSPDLTSGGPMDTFAPRRLPRMTRRDVLRTGLAAGALASASWQPYVKNYAPNSSFDYGNRAATLWLDR